MTVVWPYVNIDVDEKKMPESIGNLIKGGIRSFFEYDTPKVVHIKSIKVGLINRLIQLLILGYIVGYVCYIFFFITYSYDFATLLHWDRGLILSLLGLV